jgi:hypothetical protein
MLSSFVMPQEVYFPSSKDDFIKSESDDEQRSDAEMELDDEQQGNAEMLCSGHGVKAEDNGSSSKKADDHGEEGYGGNAAAAATAAAAAAVAAAAAGSGVAFGFSHDGDEYDNARMRQEISLNTQTNLNKYSSSKKADDHGEEGYGGNAAAAATAAAAAAAVAAAAAAVAAAAAAGSGVAFGFSHDGDEYDNARMRQEISLNTQTNLNKYSSSGTNQHGTRLWIMGRVVVLLEGNAAMEAAFVEVNMKCGVKKKGQPLADGGSSSSKRAREADAEEGDRGMQRLLRRWPDMHVPME